MKIYLKIQKKMSLNSEEIIFSLSTNIPFSSYARSIPISYVANENTTRMREELVVVDRRSKRMDVRVTIHIFPWLSLILQFLHINCIVFLSTTR